MIDTQDLRIGNYVLYHNQPVMVQSVSAGDVLINGMSIAASDSNVSPIPLCDYLLTNIRQRLFKKDRICYTYHKYSTFMIYIDDIGSFFIGLNYQDDICHVTTAPILYLHQLQNIYYAQYGEEMIINEQVLAHSIANAFSRGLLK